jgi:hypothetical protein
LFVRGFAQALRQDGLYKTSRSFSKKNGSFEKNSVDSGSKWQIVGGRISGITGIFHDLFGRIVGFFSDGRLIIRAGEIAAAAAILAFQHFESVGDHLSEIALLVVFVGVLTVGEFSFHVNQHALFEVFLGNFCLSAPNDNVVPFGLLHLVAFLVFVGFICGEGELGYCDATFQPSYFGVFAEAADESYFVDHNVLFIGFEKEVCLRKPPFSGRFKRVLKVEFFA